MKKLNTYLNLIDNSIKVEFHESIKPKNFIKEITKFYKKSKFLKTYEVYKNKTQQGELKAHSKKEAKRIVFATYGEKRKVYKVDNEKNYKLAVYWSTNDFEQKAVENFEFLKENEPKEYENFDNWEQVYDKSKFKKALQEMIRLHDCDNGITWLNIEHHLKECLINNKSLK